MRKCLKVQYLGQIEYEYHKVSVSAKKIQQKIFHVCIPLKVHKIENFLDSDFEICVISLLGMSKY
jgi:hypothetical protein